MRSFFRLLLVVAAVGAGGCGGADDADGVAVHPEACACQNGCAACVSPACGGSHQRSCAPSDAVAQTCTLCDCETYERTCTPAACLRSDYVACVDPCGTGAYCLPAWECQYCQRRNMCLTGC